MTVEELKNSDKLDLYILGLLPEGEAMEVEDILLKHPELLTETHSTQDALSDYVNEFSKAPAPGLKARVLGEIEALNKSQKNIPVKELKPAEINNSFSFYKIAAGILLLISAGLAFLLVQKNTKINALSEQLAANEVKFADQSTEFTSLRSTLNTLTDNNVKQIRLKSTDTTKNVYATFFYDKSKKQLLVQQGNLEKRDDGMQYQVWALIDGKPYSAGVFDAEPTADSLKVIATDLDAQLFAVSIEKRGGAATPTPERIILISERI